MGLNGNEHILDSRFKIQAVCVSLTWCHNVSNTKIHENTWLQSVIIFPLFDKLGLVINEERCSGCWSQAPNWRMSSPAEGQGHVFGVAGHGSHPSSSSAPSLLQEMFIKGIFSKKTGI